MWGEKLRHRFFSDEIVGKPEVVVSIFDNTFEDDISDTTS